MAITISSSSASIGVTEYFLNAGSTTASYSTTDTIVQVICDFVNMAAGDSYTLTLYDKIDGTNARPVYQVTLEGAQTVPLSTPAVLLDNWEVGIVKNAGTDRTIYYSVRKIT